MFFGPTVQAVTVLVIGLLCYMIYNETLTYSLLPRPEYSLKPDSDMFGVIELTPENWKSVYEEHNIPMLIEYYSPHCSFCREKAEVWERLGSHYSELKEILVTKFNAYKYKQSQKDIQGVIRYLPHITLVLNKTNVNNKNESSTERVTYNYIHEIKFEEIIRWVNNTLNKSKKGSNNVTV
ncbi:hypothetical protein AKO1_007903 [Acrasis kona]|uniref:Thioredoxin domain-containing protein n=1 Tax=Acrasis kona TaxID=1008807 RepID=A0AAW2YQF0_9EUKA